MSFAQQADNAVRALMHYATRPARNLNAAQLQQVAGMSDAADELLASLSDPPGPGSVNCLDATISGGASATLAYSLCQDYYTRVDWLLRSLAVTTGQVFPGDPEAASLAEVVSSSADHLRGMLESSRLDCILYPFGFGDSCEPRIPWWLYVIGGLWVWRAIK